MTTFPVAPRLRAPHDAIGPRLAHPETAELKHLRSLAAELDSASDPLNEPVDPRLWLVLAPPLPRQLEAIFLSTFLRAEPFARIARFPDSPTNLMEWLASEVDKLMASKELTTRGLVTSLCDSEDLLTMEDKDESGKLNSHSSLFDLTAGLQDIYATREILGPGQVYNRFHSHAEVEELYIVLEGKGTIRVNERVLPIAAGQCFGKPRGYDCATQIVNTGSEPMLILDVGTNLDRTKVDLFHYPDHGELMLRVAGGGVLAPTESFLPGSALWPVSESRYFRSNMNQKVED